MCASVSVNIDFYIKHGHFVHRFFGHKSGEKTRVYTSLAFMCVCVRVYGEVGGWGRDPKKCTGRDWGMGSSTI